MPLNYTEEEIVAMSEEEFQAYAERFANDMVEKLKQAGKAAGEAANPNAAAQNKIYWDARPKEKVIYDAGCSETEAEGRQACIDALFAKWADARKKKMQSKIPHASDLSLDRKST